MSLWDRVRVWTWLGLAALWSRIGARAYLRQRAAVTRAARIMKIPDPPAPPAP
jgi:hypothetical protein